MAATVLREDDEDSVGATKPAPALSVILVTWNVRELTLECLGAVRARSAGVPLELIVVDNGSGDGTADAVAERFPDATVLRNPANEGFPRANNRGLAAARGRYVLFLNSDTVVGDGTLDACVAELERDPEVGAVGCRLVYADGSTQYEGGRNAYRLRDLVAEAFYLNRLFPRSRVWAHHLIGTWDHGGRRDVEALSGAFLMVRRELALEVGGLPEDLLFAHEDLAFCLRIRRLGARIRYLGDVSTLHLTNRTTDRHGLRWYLLEGEARVRLIREAEGRFAGWVAQALFGVRSLVRLAIALVGLLLPPRLRRQYPKVFHVQRHALLLLWSVAPPLVRPLIPGPRRVARFGEPAR